MLALAACGTERAIKLLPAFRSTMQFSQSRTNSTTQMVERSLVSERDAFENSLARSDYLITGESQQLRQPGYAWAVERVVAGAGFEPAAFRL